MPRRRHSPARPRRVAAQTSGPRLVGRAFVRLSETEREAVLLQHMLLRLDEERSAVARRLDTLRQRFQRNMGKRRTTRGHR